MYRTSTQEHVGDDRPAPLLSVVVPIFNEEEALPLTVQRLRPILDGLDVEYEVVGVDDGSTDATPQLMVALRRVWMVVGLVEPEWSRLCFSQWPHRPGSSKTSYNGRNKGNRSTA